MSERSAQQFNNTDETGRRRRTGIVSRSPKVNIIRKDPYKSRRNNLPGNFSFTSEDARKVSPTSVSLPPRIVNFIWLRARCDELNSFRVNENNPSRVTKLSTSLAYASPHRRNGHLRSAAVFDTFDRLRKNWRVLASNGVVCSYF